MSRPRSKSTCRDARGASIDRQRRYRGTPDEARCGGAATERHLYVLGLQDGCYYVGISRDFHRRLIEHCNGDGAAWTSEHKVEFVDLLVHQPGDFDEMTCTLKYMQEHGIERVRGAQYCGVKLKADEVKQIEMQLSAAEERCYKCKQTGHLARSCPNPTLLSRRDSGPWHNPRPQRAEPPTSKDTPGPSKSSSGGSNPFPSAAYPTKNRLRSLLPSRDTRHEWESRERERGWEWEPSMEEGQPGEGSSHTQGPEEGPGRRRDERATQELMDQLRKNQGGSSSNARPVTNRRVASPERPSSRISNANFDSRESPPPSPSPTASQSSNSNSNVLNLLKQAGIHCARQAPTEPEEEAPPEDEMRFRPPTPPSSREETSSTTSTSTSASIELKPPMAPPHSESASAPPPPPPTTRPANPNPDRDAKLLEALHAQWNPAPSAPQPKPRQRQTSIDDTSLLDLLGCQ